MQMQIQSFPQEHLLHELLVMCPAKAHSVRERCLSLFWKDFLTIFMFIFKMLLGEQLSWAQSSSFLFG